MNTHLVKIAILQMLDACGKYLMPEETLRTQLELTLPGKLLDRDFKGALRSLDTGGYITGVEGSLDSGVKWRITELGKTEIT